MAEKAQKKAQFRQVYQAPPGTHMVGNGEGIIKPPEKTTGEEKVRRPVEFIKLSIFELLFIAAAVFLGASSKFIFTNPFFFVTWDSGGILRVVLFVVSLLVFLAVFGLVIIASHDSFLEFMPGWLLGSIGFLIGVGNFSTAGWVLGGGFLISCVVFYFFAQGDLEDSFTFSVRHAFSALSIFLTLLFAVFSAAYYFSSTQVLANASDLPDETIQPIYDFQRNIWAKRLGIPEDEVEAELERMEEEGTTIEVFGLFETDQPFDPAHPYDWFKGSFKQWLNPFMRWITLGLAISLFLTISIFITPINLIAKAIIWLFVEALVAVGVFKKSVETREATIVGL